MYKYMQNVDSCMFYKIAVTDLVLQSVNLMFLSFSLIKMAVSATIKVPRVDITSTFFLYCAVASS